MIRANQAWLSARLEEMADETRDVHLFKLHGQIIFPIYGVSGAVSTNAAVYLISRGKDGYINAPFPAGDGEVQELGGGWITMCVRLPYHESAQEWVMKIQAAEEKLRAMKSGGSNAT